LVFKQFKVETYNLATATDKTSLMGNSKFKGQLALYLNDCPDIQPRLRNLRYSEGSLLKLFVHYGKCVEKPAGYVNARKELELEAGLVAGATITSVDFVGDPAFSYLTNVDFNTSVDPAVGLFIDFKLLRSRGLKVRNDFLFTSFEINGNGTDGGTSFPSYTSVSSFKYQYLKNTSHGAKVPGEGRDGLPGRGDYYRNSDACEASGRYYLFHRHESR
jgi:hypothetical protein